MKKALNVPKPGAPSPLIDGRIRELTDWRGPMLTLLRKLIGDAAPELAEEWKWNTPVWSKNGSVVAVGAFKDHVKVNFFKGAKLADPRRLLNAGLDAKTSRAIDISKGGIVNELAFKALVRDAVFLNSSEKETK